jgi:hypothetical protein
MFISVHNCEYRESITQRRVNYLGGDSPKSFDGGSNIMGYMS